MDYAKLIRPYAKPATKGGPERTPEGQREWLVKRKGVPEDIADLAMATVYGGLEAGQTYPSGHELDRAIFAECVTLTGERAKSALDAGRRQFETRAWQLYQARREAARPRNILRHPVVSARWYADTIGFFFVWLVVGVMIGWWLHGG